MISLDTEKLIEKINTYLLKNNKLNKNQKQETSQQTRKTGRYLYSYYIHPHHVYLVLY